MTNDKGDRDMKRLKETSQQSFCKVQYEYKARQSTVCTKDAELITRLKRIFDFEGGNYRIYKSGEMIVYAVDCGSRVKRLIIGQIDKLNKERS